MKKESVDVIWALLVAQLEIEKAKLRAMQSSDSSTVRVFANVQATVVRQVELEIERLHKSPVYKQDGE